MDSATGDTLSLQLGFADGSIGTVHYFAKSSRTRFAGIMSVSSMCAAKRMGC